MRHDFNSLLGGDHLGPASRSAVVAFSFVLPHLCTVLFMTPALARWGVYGAVGLLLRWRAALLLAGAPHGLVGVVADEHPEDMWGEHYGP